MIKPPWMIAAQTLFRTWAPALLGAGLSIPPALLVGQCQGKHAEQAGNSARQARSEAAAVQQARKADLSLSESRSAFQDHIDQQRKETDDATAAIPDQAPTVRQRARACLELRRQAAAAHAADPAC